jgi:hypothetical protein
VLKVDVGNGGKLDKTAAAFGLISFKDSVMYLLDNGISTTMRFGLLRRRR